MIERIESIDRELFLFLNGLHSEAMDPIMYLVSSKFFWIPLYLFLFFMVQRRRGWAGLGIFVLAIALVILFCDQLSSSLFKPYFERYRPCNNLEIRELIHTVLGRCGSGYSFISGHATNYFGLATLSALVIGGRWEGRILILWAAVIAFSRVYLGVHYPSDIALGGLFGIVIGYGVYRLYLLAMLRIKAR